MGLGKILPVRYVTKIPAWLGRSDKPVVRRTYVATRTVVRRVVNAVSPLQLGWVGVLHTARWLDDTTYEISGWAFERGMDFSTAEPRIRVRLRTFGQPDVEADVVRLDEPLANTRVKDTRLDYSPAGFVARFDAGEIIRLGKSQPRTWRVVATVTSGRTTVSGTFLRRVKLGSANHLFARTFDGLQVVPNWGAGHGLSLTVAQPPVLATSCEVDGRTVTADLKLTGLRFGRAEVVSPQFVAPMTCEPLPNGNLRVRAVLPPVDPHGATTLLDPDGDEGMFSSEFGESTVPVLSCRLVVVDSAAKRHAVATVLDPRAYVGAATQLPFAYPGPDGTLRLRYTEAMLIVTDVEVGEGPQPGVRVRGRILGDPGENLSVELIGARARRPMTLERAADGTFEASGDWLASRWGQQPSPPPSGQYSLRALGPDGRWVWVAAAPGLVEDAPRKVELERFTCVIGVGGGRRLAFSVQPLLTPTEIGSYRQAQLARRYHRPSTPVAEQFYFEAFGGSAATCNPLGLDREVARRLPDVPRYWGVTDAAVAVPEGAIPVVQGTEAWWRARQSSRYVITNEWLKRSFQHLPSQLVLQTWHGSMLKRIGLDRPTTDVLSRRNLLQEASKWDLLLSQNPHSTRIFASAYAWDREIWEEGYPRNDKLFTADPAELRRSLGIPADKIVVLYAPTWRENRTEMVTFLDLQALMSELGDDYLLLLRGHSRTKGFGADVHLPGVLDVTSYPNITDLFVVADAMVTDYSSVMFDYSVTGRPMIFFVPDMDDYRDSLRGVYFDLSEVAPGPVLATQEEVVDAIRTIDADRVRFADRYREWQQRFNPHDDGHVAERIITRLLARS